MQYSGKFVEKYDLINAKKDYNDETEFILNAYGLYSEDKLKNILDIGCGTGEHSHILASKTEANIHGFDPSSEMISLANKKYDKVLNCSFSEDNIPDLNFDLVISMFYVVNHILSLDKLENYFKLASSNCKEGGIFIFDCFNGVAALRDPPRRTFKTRTSSENIKVVTTSLPENNLFNSFTHLKYLASIYDRGGLIEEFQYDLKHALWTPFILQEIARRYKFEIIGVYSPYHLDEEATQDDYKIVYVCKRGKNK